MPRRGDLIQDPDAFVTEQIGALRAQLIDVLHNAIRPMSTTRLTKAVNGDPDSPSDVIYVSMALGQMILDGEIVASDGADGLVFAEREPHTRGCGCDDCI